MRHTTVSPEQRKAASVAAAELRRAARCSICLDTMTACTSLPCAHVFCEGCILAHVENSAGKKGFKCPMCGAVATKRLLQRDDSLQSIVDACIDAADAFEDEVAACEIELAQPADYIHPALAAASDKSKAEPNETQQPQQRQQRQRQQPRYDVDSDEEDDEQPAMDIAHDERDAAPRATQSTEPATEHTEPPQVVHIFSVGDVVHVQARTWPGVNKPGGVARVVAVNEDGSYDVKYVIGGGESGVAPEFVSFPEDLTLDRRARKRAGPEILSEPAKTTPPPRSTRQQSSSKRAKNQATQRTPLAPVQLNMLSQRSSQSPRQQPRYEHIVVLGTHLEPNEQRWLDNFASTFGVQVAHQFCDEVTHVVTHAGEVRGKPTALRRSMKLLQGMMSGKWILSPLWLKDALKQGRVLAEEAYEVEAPKCEKQDATRRARLDVQRGGKLFRDIAVWLTGGFASPAPPKADLASLLQMGGAAVCTTLEELLASGKRHKVVVCGIDAPTIPAGTALHLTRFAWVLDCVSNYRVLPFQDYAAEL